MENYQQLEIIKQNINGNIIKIKRIIDNEILICKEIYYGQMDEKELQQLMFEVNIMKQIQHQNIVKYHDKIVDTKNQQIFIIQEYHVCDLSQYLKKYQKHQKLLPEDLIWNFLIQLILSIHQIHRNKPQILHRDIKPSSIFLDSQKNIKLGNFGLAKKLNDNLGTSNLKTPYYISPEYVKGENYCQKSDIWSIGCLLYELSTLSPPQLSVDHQTQEIQINNENFERIPNQYSDEMIRVIAWCLQKNKECRPTIDDLLNIPNINIKMRETRLSENLHIIGLREKKIQQKEENCGQKLILIQKREEEYQQKYNILQIKQNEINKYNNSSRSSKYSSHKKQNFSGPSTIESIKGQLQLNNTITYNDKNYDTINTSFNQVSTCKAQKRSRINSLIQNYVSQCQQK